MIENEQEYRVTRATIRRLEAGLAQAEDNRARRDPLAQWLPREGIEGQLESLREQLAEYESRRQAIAGRQAGAA